jgi:Putative Flp pilus-assembly TadE/G-like
MGKRDTQEGYSLVIIVSLLTVFLGFVALAVDVGVLSSARASAQRAADAAALGGAFSFVVDPTSAQPATAKQQAVSVAATNKVLGAPVIITTSDADVLVDVANHRVTVNVTVNQGTLFARVLGENTATIHVQAIAEASLTATGSTCVKPWFLSNTTLSNQAGITDPCTACDQGKVLVELDPNNPGYRVTSWGNSLIQSGQNTFVLKESDPHDALAPGQFFEIDPPGGSSEYRASIEQCVTVPFYCGQVKTPLTGNRIGPTDQGTKTLIGCPNFDTYVSPGVYQPPGNGPTRDTSRSLVTVAIWDACHMTGFCPGGQFPSGTTPQMPIVGFALVFVEGLVPQGNPTATPDCNGNTVRARLINISACGDTSGASGGGTPTPPVGTSGFPVRLVR